MAPPTYESQGYWEKIQAFLPSRLHLIPGHSPTEEFWVCRGHNLHIDRWQHVRAKARVILHHGIGTHGREMSMILGRPLHDAGIEVVAIDLPGYGMTQIAPGSPYSYDDWVGIAADFFEKEAKSSKIPHFIYGLSAGGMLCYQVATKLKTEGRPTPVGLAAMCFLDARHQNIMDMVSRNMFMSRVAAPMGTLVDNLGLGFITMPFKFVCKMNKLCNNGDCLNVCLRDNASANAWVSMRFVSSWMKYKPAQEWDEFDVCPILLTQPAKDEWTPLAMSRPLLDRVKKVPVKIVELENAGHYPLEDPGLQQMADAIITFVNELSLGIN